MMVTNDTDILALCVKRIVALDKRVRVVTKLPGPTGRDGVDGKQGETGQSGKDGKKGETGKKGTPGKNGKDGAPGKDGKDGAPGKDGKDGEQGDTGPIPDHQWKSSKLRFQKPDGEWGKYVDLQGPASPEKSRSIPLFAPSGGGSTAGGFDPSGLALATNNLPAEFVVKQGGAWVRATYEQMRAWFPYGALPDGTTTVNGDAVTVNGGFVTVTGI